MIMIISKEENKPAYQVIKLWLSLVDYLFK